VAAKARTLGVWPRFVEPAERVSKGTRATWKDWPFTATSVAGTVTDSAGVLPAICQLTGVLGNGMPPARFVTALNRSEPGLGDAQGGLSVARDGAEPRGEQEA
jgi:hypothetical protein